MRKGLLGVLGYCLFGAGGLFAQTSLPDAGSRAQTPPALGGSAGEPAPAMCDSPFTEVACDEPYCIWASADYLLSWVPGAPLPGPLVLGGNRTVVHRPPPPRRRNHRTPPDRENPHLGQPGTQVLLGNGDQGFGAFSGMRFTLGAWIDHCEGTLGIEATGFWLPSRSASFFAASDAAGNPPLFIPFNNTAPGVKAPDSVFIADPLQKVAGSVGVTSTLQLWGVELNGLLNVYRRDGVEFNLLAGFRYVDLRESLSISTFSQDLVDRTITTTNDHFDTRNQFYGGQLGGRVSLLRDRWSVDVTGKVALGSTHQVVDIQGDSSQSGPKADTPGTFPGGIFTQPSNIGRYTGNQFAVLPSAELKIGYQLTECIRVAAGYEFLYWTQVVRPGNQIDHNVNPTQSTILSSAPGALIGPAQPAPLFNRSDFWVHTISFGLEFRY